MYISRQLERKKLEIPDNKHLPFILLSQSSNSSSRLSSFFSLGNSNENGDSQHHRNHFSSSGEPSCGRGHHRSCLQGPSSKRSKRLTASNRLSELLLNSLPSSKARSLNAWPSRSSSPRVRSPSTSGMSRAPFSLSDNNNRRARFC